MDPDIKKYSNLTIWQLNPYNLTIQECDITMSDIAALLNIANKTLAERISPLGLGILEVLRSHQIQNEYIPILH